MRRGELLELVPRLMALLLSGDHPTAERLRHQYAVATVTDVDLTGAGFFVNFAVPDDVPRTEPAELIGGHVTIHVEGLVWDAGCLLFVREGVISFLEGFAYDGEWPVHPVVVGLSAAVPLLAMSQT